MNMKIDGKKSDAKNEELICLAKENKELKL